MTKARARVAAGKLYKIGFQIYGIVDDATGRSLGAWVLPSNRLGFSIAYCFLCVVEKYGSKSSRILPGVAIYLLTLVQEYLCKQQLIFVIMDQRRHRCMHRVIHWVIHWVIQWVIHWVIQCMIHWEASFAAVGVLFRGHGKDYWRTRRRRKLSFLSPASDPDAPPGRRRHFNSVVALGFFI